MPFWDKHTVPVVVFLVQSVFNPFLLVYSSVIFVCDWQKNPKYPDFKHKDTGEALWVEGRNNPPWVKSQLAKLDTRMGSLQWQDARKPVSAMASDDALSF